MSTGGKMKKCLILTGILFLFFFALSNSDDAKIFTGDRTALLGDIPISYVSDEIVIQLKSDRKTAVSKRSADAVAFTAQTLSKIAADYRVEAVVEHFPGSKPEFINGHYSDLSVFYKVKISSGNVDDVVAAFKADPNIETAEKIPIMPVYATPNDGFFAQQWHLNRANDHDVDAPEAWDVETGDATVVVAVMDTGVRYFHKDLGGSNASYSTPTGADGNIWINWAEKNGTAGVDDDGNGYVDDWVGYDWVTGTSSCWSGEDCSTPDNDPRDFNGHGTHCAGNVAAINNNGYATAASAGGWGNGTLQPTGNGVKVMALRIGWSAPYLGIYEVGYVRMDFAASAFDYARIKGAKIASCSWGSSSLTAFNTAVTNFINAGGIIFVAAGNSNNQTADYLNARTDHNIVSVAALDSNGCKADFSSYGTWVDISAPGTGIMSSYHDHADPTNDYVAAMDGTSMATPVAASIGALLWSKNPSWTATQVVDTLKAYVDNIYGLTCNSSFASKLGTGRVNAYKVVTAGGTPCDVVANFSGSPTSGCAPLTVNFTDQSSGPVTSWSWNFGDGGTSTAQNPSHQYTAAGTYTVTLTATSAVCNDVETKTNYITVSGVPTAQFVGSPTSGSAPLTVNFTDQSTGNPTSWSWNFGDGGTSTAQNPSHQYTAAGTYTVTLTATNACGSDQEIKTGYITVSAAPTWTVITFDNFETGMGNYTDGGADMSRYTGGTYAHQGVAAADIQDNSGVASSFYHTASYDVTGYNTLEVAFWFQMVSMEKGEDFWVQYFDGSTWRTVATFAQGATYGNNIFYNAVVTISRSSYNFPTNAKIRFMCDASNNADDVYIDEIEFRGSTSTVAVNYNDDPPVVAKDGPLPMQFELYQNYPNPFNPLTTIEMNLPVASHWNITIFNITGQRVAEFDGYDNAGKVSVIWDASRHASGIYLYKASAAGVSATRKMVLLK